MSNHTQRDAIRAYMREHDVNYTTARRSVRDQALGSTPVLLSPSTPETPAAAGALWSETATKILRLLLGEDRWTAAGKTVEDTVHAVAAEHFPQEAATVGPAPALSLVIDRVKASAAPADDDGAYRVAVLALHSEKVAQLANGEDVPLDPRDDGTRTMLNGDSLQAANLGIARVSTERYVSQIVRVGRTSGGPSTETTALQTADGRTVPLVVGGRVRFHPQGSGGNWWWTIRAFDDRYVVATQSGRFGAGIGYTVMDLHHEYRKRPVRSSLNTLGGGFDVGEQGENAHEAIEALRSGKRQLSNRRIIDVTSIEVEGDDTHPLV